MRKIIFSLVAMMFFAFSSSSLAQDIKQEPTVKTITVGEIKVSLISEGNVSGKEDLLLNLKEADKEKYLPDGEYLSAINVFLVSTPEGNFLIDTGFGNNLYENLEKLGISYEDVNAVLLTHMHGDHIGGLLKDGQIAFPNAQVFVADKELAYWQDKDAGKVVMKYQDEVKIFDPNALGANGGELFKGIMPIAAYGHTPGHTMYLIQSGEEKLLIWGDLTHAMAIQIPVPDVAIKYDLDPEQAVRTRKAVLQYVAQNQILVAGMHIPIPAFGKVLFDASIDGYKFASYQNK